MLYKELEDCEQCPLYKDLCPGGWTSSPSGNPIEPPCTNWKDDDDLDELYDNAIASNLAHEEYLERKWAEEEKRKKINEEKAKRSEESRWATRHERNQISKLRKQIRKNNMLLNLSRSFASAFNMTNEMFGHEERIVEKSKKPLELENEILQSKIEEVDKIRKEKLKQLRSKRRDDKKQCL